VGEIYMSANEMLRGDDPKPPKVDDLVKRPAGIEITPATVDVA
jgi:hypothetical protein